MIKAGDFLAGGGGVTEALTKIEDVQVAFVLNHSQKALRTNLFHHRKIKHYEADLYKQDEHEMEHVEFLWASIECTQHSKANGGKSKKIGSFMMGWELIRYIKHINPFVVGIENVPEFKKWGPVDENGNPIKERMGEEFNKWKQTIIDLGFEYHELICNAADYGLPTKRLRYFAFFTRKELHMKVNWPKKTHNKMGTNGLKKWVPCGPLIDLERTGESIFGRKYNINIKKGKRKPLVHNTLKRIAGGIKKHAPDMYHIFQYYTSGDNTQSINSPLAPIVTKDRHVLVQTQFIQDHTQTDNYNTPDDPLNPILTREMKQLVTIEKIQFILDYFGRDNTDQSLEGPANTITTENSKHLATVQFFSKYYGGRHHSFSIDDPMHTITARDTNLKIDAFISHAYNNPVNDSLEDPLAAITTQEKIQFITSYFSSDGNQHTQNSSLEDPLNAITTGANKQALVSAILDGTLNFDIKARFLDPDELGRISTFPERYFTHKDLKLSKKDAVKLIGNAVPPEWAKLIIEPVINELKHKLQS